MRSEPFCRNDCHRCLEVTEVRGGGGAWGELWRWDQIEPGSTGLDLVLVLVGVLVEDRPGSVFLISCWLTQS